MASMLHLCILAFVAAPGCGWQPPTPVTRADLGNSLMRFERAYEAAPPDSAKLKDVNLRFDKASLAFFNFNYAEVMRGLDAILQGPLAPGAVSDAAKVAASLKLRITPRALVKGAGASVEARISSCYELIFPDTTSVSLKLRISPASGGAAILEQSFTAPIGPSTRIDIRLPLSLDESKLATGAYLTEIVPTGGSPCYAGKWYVIAGDLAQAHDANAARLDAISSEAPAIQQAVAVCRARNELLTATPSEDRLIEYLSDPAALAPQIESELAALEAGRNPYAQRTGDYWRIFKTDNSEIPARIYAPPGLKLDQPLTLVVALHGAGGDENMFPDSYGAGRIRRLADEKGFLLVCPLTYPLLTNPMLFDRMLTLLAYDYAINPDRVHVIGHSLGSVAAARLCTDRGSLIASAACLTGAGDLSAGKEIPPVLVVGAEVDQIVPIENVRQAAQKAIDKGLPVTYRELADYGHTLMVNAALPDAVNWILERPRTAPTGRKKPASQKSR